VEDFTVTPLHEATLEAHRAVLQHHHPSPSCAARWSLVLAKFARRARYTPELDEMLLYLQHLDRKHLLDLAFSLQLAHIVSMMRTVEPNAACLKVREGSNVQTR
jgi:hypothetical protein